ncbi:MAG: hypothetical protein KKH80_00630 [Candidatus Omnitrophica bacterium]|nr:hypothetical protein [Candidatus Omnitrophota bacterium]
MKRLCLIILLSILLSTPVFSAKGGEKGASEQAYEHASNQTIFNRAGDWFATVGKSAAEKARILQERKAQRTAKRSEKEVQKAVRKSGKAEEKAQRKEIQTRERVREEVQEQQGIKTQTWGKTKGNPGKGKR